jgi:lipase chaperone LimK
MPPRPAVLLSTPRLRRLPWLVATLVLASAATLTWRLTGQEAVTTVVTRPQVEAPWPAPSLAGTEPDGQVHQAGGQLLLGPQLLHRFDYWLTTYGERPLDAIEADVRHDMAKDLNAEALAQAMSLWKAYVAFKAELARLPALPSGTLEAASLAQQVQAVRAVRARHFTAAQVQALFATGDADDDLALARLRIQQDTTLTAAERTRRLTEVQSRLTPAQREAEAAPLLHQTVRDAVEAARARGADAAEVLAIRTRLVGPEAAARLAALDDAEAAWQTRVQRYHHLLQHDPQEAAAHKAAQFSETEQLRLAAYEP